MNIRVDRKAELGHKVGRWAGIVGSLARQPQNLAAELVWLFTLRWMSALSIK